MKIIPYSLIQSILYALKVLDSCYFGYSSEYSEFPESREISRDIQRHMKKSVRDTVNNSDKEKKIEEGEKQEGFDKERGIPTFIPRSLVEEHEFTIECAAGEPNPKLFKFSKGLLMTRVPPIMAPPLEYGDHIVSVNGEAIEDKAHFYELIRDSAKSHFQHTVRLTIERVATRVPLAKDDPEVIIRNAGNNFDLSECNEYLRIPMIFFPGSSLGICIKSLNNKVFVGGTDNGWNSIGRRGLLIGDAILSVDGVTCTTVAQTGELLKEGLKTKGICNVVVERAADPMAIAYVREVLRAEKYVSHDPQMQDDIIFLCKEQVAAMKTEEKLIANLKPIYRTKPSKEAKRIQFSKNSKEFSIGQEMWNPKFLRKVGTELPIPGKVPKPM